jgi:hypothetical protein
MRGQCIEAVADVVMRVYFLVFFGLAANKWEKTSALKKYLQTINNTGPQYRVKMPTQGYEGKKKAKLQHGGSWYRTVDAQEAYPIYVAICKLQRDFTYTGNAQKLKPGAGITPYLAWVRAIPGWCPRCMIST